MCHQVIEKMLKGYYWKTVNAEPPYIHNLLLLPKKRGIFDIMPEQYKNLIITITPLNIQTRYPGDKEKFLKILNDEICTDIYFQTGEMKKWIMQLLKR